MKKHQSRTTSPRRSVLACALASCLVVATPQVLAQSTGATLRGQVQSSQAGTPITATNVATGAVRRTQTNANGSYTLVGLPPGTYRIEAGPGTERTVTLSVASTATLDLGQPATSEGGEAGASNIATVSVTGTALRDVKTSEVGNTISLRQIQQLPQATRNFLEFADTVPGMAFTTDAQGFTSLRSGATNGSSGNLYIDGVGQKGYVEAGGVAGQNNSRGNPFSQLAIGEYKVITSNYKAEYGQITGAAITAATKSGTNEFEGEAFYRYTNQDLREKRADEEAPGKDKVDSLTKEWGVAFGGPIIQDRLHFFAVYEKKDLVTPRTVVPDSNVSQFQQYLPADVQAKFGPVSAPFEEDLWFGKLSWNVSDDDLIEFSAQVRDEVQVDSIGDQRAAEHGRDVINKDKRMTLRWQHSAASFTNEAIATTEDTQTNPFPMSLGNGINYAVIRRTPAGGVQDEPTLIETGPAGGFDAFRREQDGWSIIDNLTLHDIEFAGTHTFKTGVSYKDISLTSQDAGAINPQFRYNVTTAGAAATPYKVEFLSPYTVPGQRPTVETDSKQYGFYIQDDWQVNDHLILNLGVRWDYEKNPAYTDFVTSPAFVSALYADDPDLPGTQPWANRLLPSGINVADYISNGSNRDDFKDAWAPRFGFSYDLDADERHVIHGGAGRSYDRNLFKLLSLEVSKAALSPVTVHFQDPATGQCYQPDTVGRPCVAWNPNYLTGIEQLWTIPGTAGSAELFMLNNDLRTPYSDQYSLGMANQVGDWQTDVTIQRIKSYDGFVFTLINRYSDGSFFQNGSAPWGEAVPGYANTILGSNGIETTNDQILISLDKPYSRDSGWGVNLSYTHTDAMHNRSRDEAFAFDKPTIDQYPFIYANDVPEHRFVASGSIDGFWDMTFGMKIVLETPRYLNSVENFGLIEADGSPYQPVAYKPPGTGKFLFGGDIFGYRTVDLQATKEFKLPGDTALTARINVLNAFNWKNYSNFNLVGRGTQGSFQPEVTVNEFGNMYYIPRTLSVEVGFKF